MGFSSSRLQGAVSNAVPTISYAYATTNTQSFGIPGYYNPSCTYVPSHFLPAKSKSAFGTVGLATPYLVFPTPGPKLSCTPFPIGTTASVKCPVANTALTSGLYTLSFSQYSSTYDAAMNTYVQADTVEHSIGLDVTFSITTSPAVITTSTITAHTTLTSGTLDVTPTTTVPSSVSTVTVYQSTTVVAQVSTSTLNGALTSTVGVCPSTISKPMVCYHDNCLRAMLGRANTASEFCATYTLPPPSLPLLQMVANRIPRAWRPLVPVLHLLVMVEQSPLAMVEQLPLADATLAIVTTASSRC